MRFACAWVRKHPRDARLLLVYRREDFIDGPWPEPLRRRAERLAEQAEGALRAYCKRLYGRTTTAGLSRIRLAISDLPQAAARPYLESKQRLPRQTEELVADATAYLLRRRGQE